MENSSSCDTCDRIRANLQKGTRVDLNNNIEDYSTRKSLTEMALSSTTKQVAATYAGGIGGKVISYGLASYDAQKGVSLASPAYKSAFFVGNLAVSVLAAAVAIHQGRKGKLSGSMFGALVGAGTVATSELVDTIEKTVLGKRLTYSPPRQFYSAPAPRYNLSGVDTVIPTGKAGTYRGLT